MLPENTQCRCGAEKHEGHCCAEPVKIEVPDPRPCKMCAFGKYIESEKILSYDGHSHGYYEAIDGRFYFIGNGGQVPGFPGFGGDGGP